MTHFSEELEQILSQILMKHHDDISSQDDDAIAEARDAITELVKGIVPSNEESRKIWCMAIGNCEDSGVPILCATKEIAERELFKARDQLVAEWKEQDNFLQANNAKYCKENNLPPIEENMYKDMIQALSSNDYEKWDNYPHQKPYIYENEVLDK